MYVQGSLMVTFQPGKEGQVESFFRQVGGQVRAAASRFGLEVVTVDYVLRPEEGTGWLSVVLAQHEQQEKEE